MRILGSITLEITTENAADIAKFLARQGPETTTLAPYSSKVFVEEPQAKTQAEPHAAAVEEPQPEVKTIPVSAIRAVAAQLSTKGKSAELRKLFVEHGGAKLSEIAQEDYAALLAAMEVLRDG